MRVLPLRTERLVLRPFVAADAAPFARYRSDAEVARYQSWDTPYPLSAAQELIAQMQSRQTDGPRPGEWNQIAIGLLQPRPQDEPLIGDCAFQLHAGDPRQASIGFTLARAYQRRGYATEAVRALVHELLGAVGLHRVTAVCDAENTSSQRVLERVGMRREAHFVQNIHFKGAWGSEVAYAVLNHEWPGRALQPGSI